MSTSYLNKNRIDAVLRVDKFSPHKHNNGNGTDNLRAEFKRWGSSISVLKPINGTKTSPALPGDIDVQITNVGIPYLNKENLRNNKVKLNKKTPTHLLTQVKLKTITFFFFVKIKKFYTKASHFKESKES